MIKYPLIDMEQNILGSITVETDDLIKAIMQGHHFMLQGSYVQDEGIFLGFVVVPNPRLDDLYEVERRRAERHISTIIRDGYGHIVDELREKS